MITLSFNKIDWYTDICVWGAMIVYSSSVEEHIYLPKMQVIVIPGSVNVFFHTTSYSSSWWLLHHYRLSSSDVGASIRNQSMQQPPVYMQSKDGCMRFLRPGFQKVTLVEHV